MSKKPLPSGQNDISNSHLLGLKACEAIENVKLLKKKIQFDIKISFVQVLPLRQQRLEYVLGRIGLQIEMIRLQMIQKTWHDVHHF